MPEDKVIPQRKNSGRKKSTDRAIGGTQTSAAENKGETAAARRNPRLAGIRPRISIEELRNAFKRQASVPQDDTDSVFDPLSKAQKSKEVTRKKTGIVYDEVMAEHKCLWDPKFPECPERLLQCLERCRELNLLGRCERLESRRATEEELLKLHSRAVIDLLHCTQREENPDALETLSSHYDSIYIHPITYKAATLAAGSTLVLLDSIVSGQIQNGMALIRPPGHHAMKSEYCGYCFFNNVALAAQRALEKHNMSRILIVDWDVHHGQATQQMFYDDPRVLYFSIHRYEHGSFWPELKESEYTHVGNGPGKGFNFNLPLNKVGMKNEDYLAIFHQVLLPVAYEFNPELVLISCGYDGAVGCPEFAPELVLVSAGFDSALADEKGEMEVTPAFYSHLTSSLMSLAEGRIAVVLEGGYCLESTAEGAAKTLGALLGDPCPQLMNPIRQPCQSVQESILNLVYVHRPYWKCFQYQSSFSVHEDTGIARHMPTVTYLGTEPKLISFPTRNCYPNQSSTKLQEIALRLKQLKEFEHIHRLPTHKLCLVYDDEMCKHRNMSEKEHPERPARIERIWQQLVRYGVTERALILKSRRATREEIEAVHTKEHVDFMYSLNTLTESNILDLQDTYKSIYLHPQSNDSALLSCGSLLQVVDSVCTGESQGGIGVIRPPGHHAEKGHPHGFCMYNNVAVAARYATQKYNYQRIMIFDWDVHHGNGIQHEFESDPTVLYVSIHRYDDGLFFPSSEDGNYDRVGTGKGEGFNVNIPWNKNVSDQRIIFSSSSMQARPKGRNKKCENASGMGDAEYMSAMLQVVMPVAYQFDPQLVLVSAGFDAARGDPLGGCRVSPECYGHMTSLLMSLAGGRLVLALEGGYNLNVISYCMTMCAKAILGDPMPLLENALVPNKRAVETITDVIRTHSQYWSCLCFQVALPIEDVLAQGFGGVPQVVESGVSGSEVSSCNSSPASTPSTASPMYVSAPSSPDKSWREKHRNCDDDASLLTTEHEAEICMGQLKDISLNDAKKDLSPSESQCNTSASSQQYSTPDSSEKLSPSVRSGNFLQTPTGPHVKHKSENGKMKPKMQQCYSFTPTRPQRIRKSADELLLAAAASIGMKKKPTAIIFDEVFSKGFVGKESTKTPVDYYQGLQLLQSCTTLASREVSEAELPFIFNDGFLKKPSSEREMSIVLRAVGSLIDMLSNVVTQRCQNGMAVVQLPESTSPETDKCCTLQGIAAVGTKYALESLKVSRVMLVDLDVSDYESCQAFCNDNLVLRFSMVMQDGYHHKKDRKQKTTKGCDKCDSDFVLNLDCNSFHVGDYYAIFHQLVLPLAYEFAPELIIVTTRYEMAARCIDFYPSIYAHLMGLLMALAQGRVTVLSEPFRCKEVATEGVAAILSALQDIPCSSLPVPFDSASLHTKTQILDAILARKKAWRSLQNHAQETCTLSHRSKADDSAHKTEFQAKGCVQRFKKFCKSSELVHVHPLCLVYDESMMEHFSYDDRTHPECPERIRCIYRRLEEFGIVERCLRIEAKQAATKELEDLHSPKHLRMMSSLSSKKASELQNVQENYESVYMHRKTNAAALTAAGSVVAVVDSVLKGESRRAVAVVRPPGHHAERNEPCGFCFYNNVAVGAKHAINAYGLKRVFILDWDVHHGNGIQHMFESDPRVLYISIHRYDNGKFFPGSTEANYNRVGIKKGKGYNVNIPWNKGGMGDSDYMAALTEVVLPVASQFNPQLVLVSAGFDAAVKDPLGGCHVTPQCYGHMTKLLMQLAEGKVIVALEGGYNLNTISYCMLMCAKALLGDPIAPLQEGLVASPSAVESLNSVVSAQRKYWSSLDMKNTATSSPEGRFIPPSPSENSGRKPDDRKIEDPSALNPSVDDLSANFSGVSLKDEDSLVKEGRSESTKSKKGLSGVEVSREMPKEESDEMMEGAVGGTSSNQQDNSVNTFLLSEVPGAEQMYAVVPLEWCPHLQQVSPLPPSGLNTKRPCEECQDLSENWVCLTCYKVLCGRFVNEHMMMHGVTQEHYVVLSFSDLSVWCYSCDAYIHHSSLQEAKRAAHIDKFGEDVPGSA